LQTNAQVGRRSAGTRPAHHFIALSQGNRGTAGAGKGLRPLGNQANGGLQIRVRGKWHHGSRWFQGSPDMAPPGSQRSERHWQVGFYNRRLRERHGAQQVVYQAIKFGVGDEMGGLLPPE
jgi:hypothetical protein